MNIYILIMLYGCICSVSSLVLSVYLYFTSEIDTPFLQLDQKCLCEGTQTLIMITWKSANLSSEEVRSSAQPDKILVWTLVTQSHGIALMVLYTMTCAIGSPCVSCSRLYSVLHRLQWAQLRLLLVMLIKHQRQMIQIFQLVFATQIPLAV